MDNDQNPQNGQENPADTPTNSASTEQPPPVDDLAELARLADEAATHPQTSPPLRELMPILARVVRAHAETLTLLGA